MESECCNGGVDLQLIAQMLGKTARTSKVCDHSSLHVSQASTFKDHERACFDILS